MRCLLIDGNNFVYRAFGRIPLEYNGIRTDTIYLALRMMRSYLKMFSPDFSIIVYDGGRDKRRVDIFAKYKRRDIVLTKEKLEERKQIYAQIEIIKKIFSEIGVLQYRVMHREADDVIYMLTKKNIEELKNEVIVISTDSDFFQLFSFPWSDNVKLYLAQHATLYNKKSASEKFGIDMEFFQVYKSLIGDKSDNIPGVKGFGPVKARRIIEALLNHSIDQDAVGEFLYKSDFFNISLDLVTFKDIDVDELLSGRIKVIAKNVADVQINAMKVAEQFGLNEFLEKFQDFSLHFEHNFTKVSQNEMSFFC